MKRFIFIGLIITGLQAMADYDSLFYSYSLRIDYIHSGTATEEYFSLAGMKQEPYWGGSTQKLVDTFGYGTHMAQVFDSLGQLIYSRGYSSLFAEWQTTDEARLLARSFEETVVIPYPKNRIRLIISSRQRNGLFIPKFELDIDPDDYFIRPAIRPQYEVFEVCVNRPSDQAVDIVILPDGYTSDQIDLFKEDCQRFTDQLFSFEPYTSLSHFFNIRAVLAPSADSNIAVPAEGFWPETILSSNFYTFDSERYCMSTHHFTIRDLAGHVPYDQIYILTNTAKYGGGGIFNFYCLSSARNLQTAAIIVHEFGHGFAGLADEYYDSSTAYSEFYDLDTEPWEPNITTLVDFSKKWELLLEPDTPVPTPDTDDWDGITGVFEGGGYSAKGIYRPARDCLMHTFRNSVFCLACYQAIEKMILFHAD
ncbi:MAG: IgA Peptidase M64 [Bacteroidales bacterium]|nr:IgA Peptidase M64 [Bacteroidales bacterium]